MAGTSIIAIIEVKYLFSTNQGDMQERINNICELHNGYTSFVHDVDVKQKDNYHYAIVKIAEKRYPS